MPEINEYEIERPRSRDEISDVIGNPPNWLMRSGIGMVALVFGTIIFMTYFIKYPDKITGQGFMTSTTPPIELVSRSDGYIEDILVEENQLVKKGDVLVYVNNTTNPDEIEKLTDWIKKYEAIQNPRHYRKFEIPSDLQVGVLQGDYASLYLKYNELRQNLANQTTSQRVEKIYDEIDKIIKLNKSQQREKGIFKKELELSKKDYERNESL